MLLTATLVGCSNQGEDRGDLSDVTIDKDIAGELGETEKTGEINEFISIGETTSFTEWDYKVIDVVIHPILRMLYYSFFFFP
ncbi:MAG: hypothetical protein WBI44_00865 [Syntrophaceticus sp.]